MIAGDRDIECRTAGSSSADVLLDDGDGVRVGIDFRLEGARGTEFRDTFNPGSGRSSAFPKGYLVIVYGADQGGEMRASYNSPGRAGGSPVALEGHAVGRGARLLRPRSGRQAHQDRQQQDEVMNTAGHQREGCFRPALSASGIGAFHPNRKRLSNGCKSAVLPAAEVKGRRGSSSKLSDRVLHDQPPSGKTCSAPIPLAACERSGRHAGPSKPGSAHSKEPGNISETAQAPCSRPPRPGSSARSRWHATVQTTPGKGNRWPAG